MSWVHNQIGGQHRFFFLQSAPACRQTHLSSPQSRHSYFSLDAPRHTVEARDGQLHVRYYAEGGQRFDALKVGNPLDRFYKWLHPWNAPRVDGLPPFWGGVVGHFNYE